MHLHADGVDDSIARMPNSSRYGWHEQEFQHVDLVLLFPSKQKLFSLPEGLQLIVNARRTYEISLPTRRLTSSRAQLSTTNSLMVSLRPKKPPISRTSTPSLYGTTAAVTGTMDM